MKNKYQLILPTVLYFLFTFNVSAQVTSTLSLKFFIQGFYVDGGAMIQSLYYSGVQTNPLTTDVDTVTIELHPSDSVSIIAASYKGLLQTNGTINCTFSSVSNGCYYIVICHRNALETWSSSLVALPDTMVNYDFTTGADKAYGSNMAFVDNIMGQDIWALWSGDVYDETDHISYAQDGVIDSADYYLVRTDYTSNLLGYYSTDLTGNGVVDSADYFLEQVNSYSALSVSRPSNSFCSVGVTTVDNPLEFSLYPNPNGGIFHLSINSSYQTLKDVLIYDILGNLVHQNLKTGKSDLDFDLSQIAKGIYFVKVVSGDKFSVSRIVIA